MTLACNTEQSWPTVQLAAVAGAVGLSMCFACVTTVMDSLLQQSAATRKPVKTESQTDYSIELLPYRQHESDLGSKDAVL